MGYVLSPSLLAADFTRLKEETDAVTQAGAAYLHLDVMDGAFVPSISFGMPVIKSLRKVSNAVFDVHMMVEDPGRYVPDLKACGADILTVHAEACTHLDRVLNQIKDLGMKAGVAVNPATPVSSLEYILPLCDLVLIMSVNPGFGGQAFIPYTLGKVRQVRALLTQKGLDADVEVDGGITVANAREVLSAGANVLVSGSGVFGEDPGARVAQFLQIFKEVSL